jgi:YD repeat-containing protein
MKMALTPTTVTTKVVISVAVFLFLFSNLSVAQSPYVQGIKPPTFPSANAASLGKYGDIPVSYHTGTPEISIPIYTVKQGSLSLPISLSYHSSGVRVSEVASWVGLGWSLNAGGMITRTVHGGPDDGSWTGATPHSSLGIRGWYANGGIPVELKNCENSLGGYQQSTSKGPNGVAATCSGCSCFSYYTDAALGYIDTEPDLYTFNFAGHSGKFFFDESGNPHLFPEDDLYIKPIFKSGTNYFDGFDIYTPDGTKYKFGRTGGTEITKNDPIGVFGGPLDNLTSTTWYLIRVESPNGEDAIDLTYADELYSYGNRGGQTILINYLGGIVGGSLMASGVLSVSLVYGKRLSSISNSSGTNNVTFLANTLRQDISGSTGVSASNTQAKRLDQISILSGAFCKQFNLSYDYFLSSIDCNGNAPSTDFDKKRLKLNSIQEFDCLGGSLPPNLFTYNMQPMPRRYSLSRDLWDYYNGSVITNPDGSMMDSNTSLIPSSVTNPVIIGAALGTANRSVNETAMKCGILTQIRYPTGGLSSFVYEGHRKSNNELVGGLRIKQIINDDGAGGILTRNYSYDPGYLYSDLVFVQYPNNSISQAAYSSYQFGAIVSSSPSSAMWSTQGYHIGYGGVTESQTGNGKTVYSYFNSGPMGIPMPSNYPLKELLAGYGTSDESSRAIFPESSTTAISRIDNSKGFVGPEYTFQARKVVSIPCIQQSSNDACATNTNPAANGGTTVGDGTGGINNLFTDYTVKTQRYNLLSSTVMNDGVSVASSYEYGLSLNSPTAMIKIDSKGTNERFEWDYALTPGSLAPVEMYVKTNPNFKNMTTVPIVERKLRNGTLINKLQNTYIATNGKVLLTQNREYKTGGTDFVDAFYTYDPTSLRLTNLLTTGNNTKSYIWGYNNTMPIAEVVNASATQVFHTSFEDYSPTSLSTDAKTGKYSYSSLAFTIPLPSPGTYNLSYWIKPLNGTWTWVQTTVSAAPTIGGNGALLDEVRLTLAGALVTTYTYEPAIGITSVTDPNGQTTTYEYDSFGRLKATRDAKGNIVQSYVYNYKQ